jgi:hypothetical protein
MVLALRNRAYWTTTCVLAVKFSRCLTLLTTASVRGPNWMVVCANCTQLTTLLLNGWQHMARDAHDNNNNRRIPGTSLIYSTFEPFKR